MNDDLKRSLTETGLSIVDTTLACFGIVGGAQTIYAIRNLVTVIAEQAFQEKLRRFFRQIEDISDADKELFGRELGEDKEAFFRKLILILDRLDEEEKADTVGKLFRATMAKQIDKPTFRRLAGIVEKTFLEDLNHLKHYFGEKDNISKHLYFDPSLNENRGNTPLVSVGLLDETKNSIGGIPPPYHFSVTPLGEMMVKYGF